MTVGGADKTMEISHLFSQREVYVQGIRPPTVPVGRQVALHPHGEPHGKHELAGAVEFLEATGNKLGIL